MMVAFDALHNTCPASEACLAIVKRKPGSGEEVAIWCDNETCVWPTRVELPALPPLEDKEQLPSDGTA